MDYTTSNLNTTTAYISSKSMFKRVDESLVNKTLFVCPKSAMVAEKKEVKESVLLLWDCCGQIEVLNFKQAATRKDPLFEVAVFIPIVVHCFHSLILEQELSIVVLFSCLVSAR